MLQQEMIINYIETPMGRIPVVPRTLDLKDLLGTIRVRLNIGRMKLLTEDGILVVQLPSQMNDLPALKGLECCDRRRYGRNQLAFYEYTANNENHDSETKT